MLDTERKRYCYIRGVFSPKEDWVTTPEQEAVYYCQYRKHSPRGFVCGHPEAEATDKREGLPYCEALQVQTPAELEAFIAKQK